MIQTIIRIFGAVLGALSIVLFSYMIYSGQERLISTISGLLTGIIFFIYDVGGNKALSKILPGTAKIKIGK